MIGVYLLEKHQKQRNPRLNLLFLMLLGGAIFGVVDHAWNGELLNIGADPVPDILLGVAITLTTFAIWAAITVFDRIDPARAED
jgi:hypothetical protein